MDNGSSTAIHEGPQELAVAVQLAAEAATRFGRVCSPLYEALDTVTRRFGPSLAQAEKAASAAAAFAVNWSKARDGLALPFQRRVRSEGLAPLDTDQVLLIFLLALWSPDEPSLHWLRDSLDSPRLWAMLNRPDVVLKVRVRGGGRTIDELCRAKARYRSGSGIRGDAEDAVNWALDSVVDWAHEEQTRLLELTARQAAIAVAEPTDFMGRMIECDIIDTFRREQTYQKHHPLYGDSEFGHDEGGGGSVHSAEHPQSVSDDRDMAREIDLLADRAGLSPQERYVLQETADGMTQVEIAQRLGEHQSTICRRIARAKEKIRKILNQ